LPSCGGTLPAKGMPREVQISQVVKKAQELRQTSGWPRKVVSAEIKALKMMQGEQGGTYLRLG